MTKPTIPEVLPHIREYYAMPGNSVGGSLHIVLEDGNVEKGHVEACKQSALEKGDHYGVMIADLLLEMSTTQRRKLASMNFNH